jgi:hypothetical protein
MITPFILRAISKVTDLKLAIHKFKYRGGDVSHFILGKFGVHREGYNMITQFLCYREVTMLVSGICIGFLHMQRDRVVNHGWYSF